MSAGRDGGRNDPPPPGAGKRLLMLRGGDGRYLDCVREAAALTGAILHEAADAGAALALLLTPEPPYSHLLLPPGHDPLQIDDLLGLAAEDVRNEPLLLGEQPDFTWAARHMPQPSVSTLVALLAAPGTPPRRTTLPAAALSHALQAGWLRVRFQPLVEAARFRPVSFEALARLHHPQHGVLPPSSFVEALDQAPLARMMFDQVLELALAGAAPVLAPRCLQLSLNIPLALLQEETLVETLKAACARHGFAPAALILELTERHTAPEPGRLAAALNRLRDGGFGIAIDDAGPPLPHWRELVRLPFTAVKLDKSLVRYVEFAEDTALIIATARQAAMAVVAEGIETTALRDRMVGLGADYLQGFLFARPMPAVSLAPWLAAA